MDELKTYSVKLRKFVTIKDPEIVTLKNGRKAVRGVAAEDPSSKVIRFVNVEQGGKDSGDAWLIGAASDQTGAVSKRWPWSSKA